MPRETLCEHIKRVVVHNPGRAQHVVATQVASERLVSLCTVYEEMGRMLNHRTQPELTRQGEILNLPI